MLLGFEDGEIAKADKLREGAEVEVSKKEQGGEGKGRRN